MVHMSMPTNAGVYIFVQDSQGALHDWVDHFTSSADGDHDQLVLRSQILRILEANADATLFGRCSASMQQVQRQALAIKTSQTVRGRFPSANDAI